MKTCYICKSFMSKDMFYNDISKKDGKCSCCKKCDHDKRNINLKKQRQKIYELQPDGIFLLNSNGCNERALSALRDVAVSAGLFIILTVTLYIETIIALVVLL